MAVLSPELKQMPLFKRLKSAAETDDELALAANVPALVAEADARLTRCAGLHPQFTLHDHTHGRRVISLMGRLLGPRLDDLNALEAALLILSAAFHDIGMAPGAEEWAALEADPDWRLQLKNWDVEHQNLGELEARRGDPMLDDNRKQQIDVRIAELQAARVSDCLRPRHATESARIVSEQYGEDKRLWVAGVSLAPVLALLCRSHNDPTTELGEADGFLLDQSIGTATINVQRIARLLRLADILDFDRDRTPDVLHRSISFTSEVSKAEWEKHRGVQGWAIGPDAIAYTAAYENPAYEKACRDFLDWVDEELAEAGRWDASLPAQHEAARLGLPARVDRDRVQALRDPATGRAAYRYADLEFSLSRDELVKLLMTDALYRDRSLFLRELLQNGLDALRHRQALHRAGGGSLLGLEVSFLHERDEAGRDVVTCTDQGVGMDENILHRFLTRAGRSYYRSPEFEQERARFRDAGCDFDPCARFGIGFLSCFMVSDEIAIFTRRDRGPALGLDVPLVVEITGLNGIICIREGEPDQPVGTAVRVRSREAADPFDEDSDGIRLLSTLHRHAVACEFPVRARVAWGTNEPAVHAIEPERPPVKHTLRLLEEECRTSHLTVSFADADPRLGGSAEYAFLIDETGAPVLKNETAAWQPPMPHDGKKYRPNDESSLLRIDTDAELRDVGAVPPETQVSCDGIYVFGTQGRPGPARHRSGGNDRLSEKFGRIAFALDVRGDLKPELTPARTPPESGPYPETPPLWTQLWRVAGRSCGNLLNQLAGKCAAGPAPERFWQLALIDKLQLRHLPVSAFFDHLKVPLLNDDGACGWHRMSNLPPLRVLPDAPGTLLGTDDGRRLAMPETVTRWSNGDPSSGIDKDLLDLVLLASRLARGETGLAVTPWPDAADGPRLADFRGDVHSDFQWSRRSATRFTGSLSTCVCLVGRHQLLNLAHPIVRRLLSLDPVVDSSSFSAQFESRLIGGLQMLPLTTAEPGNERVTRWASRLVKLIHRQPLEERPKPDVPLCTYVDAAGASHDVTPTNLRALAEPN